MFYWICLFAVLLLLLGERLSIKKMRAKIPVRIHVHGTRGKSTFVRSITTELRLQGLRVLAKTTGDKPEYILPDGSVSPIHRIGPARIQEHIRMLSKAATMEVDAMVVEGMALQPETVWLSERILQATHAVITNARPDHAETMGRGREGVLNTLQHMIPRSGKLFTSNEEGVDFLKKQARKQNIDCCVVDAIQTEQSSMLTQAVTASVLSDQGWSRYQENLPITLISDPVKSEISGIPVHLYDFLSANDVVSSQLMLKSCSFSADFLKVALLSTRADRPLRTCTFVDWIVSEPCFDVVVFMGSHARYAFLRSGFKRVDKRCLQVSPSLSPERLLNRMRQEALAIGKKGLIVTALGNSHGYGEQWRAAIKDTTLFIPRKSNGSDRIGSKHVD